MIRIQQLKLPVTHTQEELEQKIRKTLKIGKHDLVTFRLPQYGVLIFYFYIKLINVF